MTYTTWAEVFDALHVTPEDERLHKVVLQGNEMLIRQKEIAVCSLAEASDLLEFERDVQLRAAHQRAMYQAITWGEAGHIPDSYDILELHAMLFPNGGQWRTCNVLIRGSDHVPPNAVVVPMLMKEHVDNVRWWLTSNYDPYIKLAHTHLEFLLVHPLQDGNGRVSRLLLNNQAAYLNLPFIKIADRDRYIDLLEAKDEPGLAEFFKASVL